MQRFGVTESSRLLGDEGGGGAEAHLIEDVSIFENHVWFGQCTHALATNIIVFGCARCGGGGGGYARVQKQLWSLSLWTLTPNENK